MEGWAAAGATYAVLDADGALQTSGWHERLGARANEIKVLAYTPPIPGDNVACRPGLDAEAMSELVRALVGLSTDDEGRAILHDVFRADELVVETGDIYENVRSTLSVLRGVI